MNKIEFNYLLDKLLDIPRIGRTKIQKIFFFSDLIYNGISKKFEDNIGILTNTEYIRLHYGPYSFQIQYALDHLMSENILYEDSFNHYKKRHSLFQENLDDEKKIEAIEKCLKEFSDWTADSLVRLTHRFLEWKNKENLEPFNLKPCWDQIHEALKL